MRALRLVNSLCENEGLSAAFRRHGLNTVGTSNSSTLAMTGVIPEGDEHFKYIVVAQHVNTIVGDGKYYVRVYDVTGRISDFSPVEQTEEEAIKAVIAVCRKLEAEHAEELGDISTEIKSVTEDGNFATYTTEVNKMVSDLQALGYRAINALKPSDVDGGLLFCVVVLLYGKNDYEGGESAVIARYSFETGMHVRLLDASVRIVGDEILGANPTAEEVSASIKRLSKEASARQLDLADEIKGEL